MLCDIKHNSFYFFLGGTDAEMKEIKKLLIKNNEKFEDKNLSWGAKASTYRKEIAEVAAKNLIPVLIELEVDINLPQDSVIVDHHGDMAGRKSALEQVKELLVSRKQRLIIANDTGFIPAMLELGASREEIVQIRSLDRAEQKINSKQEEEAERAISEMEVNGRLTIVRMAHSKCATITDRLHEAIGGPGYDQLLIISFLKEEDKDEINFFGDGKLCCLLQKKFKGWSGGSGLGKEGGNAFWGGYPSHKEVETFLREYFKK